MQLRLQRPNGFTSWIQQLQALKPALRKPAKLAKNSGMAYMEISANKTAQNAS